MKSTEIFKFWILIQLIYLTKAETKQKWTYEILELTSKSSNLDWVEVDYTVERIGRGKFGFSGFLHFKTDVNNDYTVGTKIERSLYRTGPFMKLPMSVDNITLSDAINTFYKETLMPSMPSCSVNAPYFEDKFEPPLTARRIELNKCDVSTENFPSVLMEGYYRMRIGVYGANSIYVESLILVENK